MALHITPKTTTEVWSLFGAVFSAYGFSKLHTIKGRMNGKILDSNLLPSSTMMKLKRGWTFQSDTYPKHTAKETLSWFQRKNIKLLEWPSQSSDLNPTESL